MVKQSLDAGSTEQAHIEASTRVESQADYGSSLAAAAGLTVLALYVGTLPPTVVGGGIYGSIHTRMYVYIHTHTHTPTYVDIHAYIYYIYINKYVYTHTYI